MDYKRHNVGAAIGCTEKATAGVGVKVAEDEWQSDFKISLFQMSPAVVF